MKPVITRMVITLLCAALAACAGAPRDYFYTLSADAPTARTQPVADLPEDVHIAMGRIVLPELVDRPQFVIRLDSHQVTLLEQRRWAEPLKLQITRVIADNLAYLLAAPVSAFLQDEEGRHYRVALAVQDFDSSMDEVKVEIAWSIRRNDNGLARNGRSRVQEQVAGGYDGIVAAHSRALAEVSRDIAAAIAAMHGAAQERVR